MDPFEIVLDQGHVKVLTTEHFVKIEVDGSPVLMIAREGLTLSELANALQSLVK